MEINISYQKRYTLFSYQIPCLGWGHGSGSNDLHQVHLQLVNQSVCHNLLNPNPKVKLIFHQDLMICAGDIENGGRGICKVGYYLICLDFKKNQQIKRGD